MPSTYSSLLRLELMQTGEKSATWGDITNTNLGTLLEKSIAGTSTIDVTAGNVTMTSLNGTDDQARGAILLVTGSPGTARNIVAPSSSKIYVLINSSNSTVTLKGAATPGIAVISGDRAVIAWNNTDFVRIGVSSDSPTFTGTTTVDGLTVGGAMSIGNAPGDSLSIAPTAVAWPNNPTHSGNHTFSGTLTAAGPLVATGSATLGDAAGDTLTINPNTVTWPNNPTHSGNHTFTGTSTFNGPLAANGSTTLGNAVGDTLNVAAGSLQVDASGNVRVGGGSALTSMLQLTPSSSAAQTVVGFRNNGATASYVGQDGSVGGLGGAYTLNVWNGQNTSLVFATNNTARGVFMASGPFVVNAFSNSALGAGNDQLAVQGSLGLSGTQINVNPAADFEMVHRGTGGWRFYTDSASKVPLKIDRLAPTDTLQLTSAGIAIGGDGRLYGLGLHNNAGSVAGTTNQYIASGTSTPTLANVANCSGAVAGGTWKWMRVGNVATFSGNFSVTITANSTITQIGVPLPVASNFTATTDLTGAVSNLNAATLTNPAIAFADVSNDRLLVQFTSGSASAGVLLTYYVVAQYEIL